LTPVSASDGLSIAHRRRLKLSNEALAQRLGVVSITQYRRETGRMAVTTPDLFRYAMVFGCQPADLLPPVTLPEKNTGNSRVARKKKASG
jgi:hypothetical protein